LLRFFRPDVMLSDDLLFNVFEPDDVTDAHQERL
jgi:hypothetical protein